MGTSIGYLDGPRLRRSILAAAAWVRAGRDELNRINVYPVPDGDTGTNFSLTLKSIADAMHRLGDAPLPEVTRTAAQASVEGARGNSGMMLSHFLLGFSEGIGGKVRVRAGELAAAIRRGFERLESALEDPVEGTILSVAREAAVGAERAARHDDNDILPVIKSSLEHADQALQRTPDQLAVLKEAGVVDAGGKGFVRLLEGIIHLIEKGMMAPDPQAASAGIAPAALAEVGAAQDFRFCTEVLVRGDRLPGSAEARLAISPLGGSLLVLRAGDLLRVHVHTDDAQAVFRIAEGWGEVVTRKADDMREQHRLLTSATREVAVVCDSSCDLPDAVLDRYGIAIVPLQLLFGSEVRLDRVEMSAAEFYRRLRAGTTATTSQPTPAHFGAAFEHARAEAKEVVVVVLSSALSGTHANAEAARRSFAAGGIHLVDSRSVSLGLGMLALRAAELAQAGWGGAAIAREVERLRDQCGSYISVDNLQQLLRSGRVSRMQAWFGSLLDMKPILALDRDGSVMAAARVRHSAALLPRVLRLLDAALPARRERLRFGVVHADSPELAERIRGALTERYRPLDVIVSPATGVLAAHVGIGAWAVFYQVDDGAPAGVAAAVGAS